jgi:GT2 family glycosyltransferase
VIWPDYKPVRGGKATDSPFLQSRISAIVTAFNRTRQTLDTLNKLQQCSPPPDELLVHVDGNQQVLASAINSAFPSVKVTCNPQSVGPGGGRNTLLSKATNEIVASFDDDSYPIDRDFFNRVRKLSDAVPDAAIYAGAVYERDAFVESDEYKANWVADFSGGACVYRRSRFLQTSGYLSLPLAYGMEEVDLALRLHASTEKVLRTPWLRVFHDTSLTRHGDPQITEASIKNIALLAYLRYPSTCYWVGFGQVLNRIFWLLKNQRRQGILQGLIAIPDHLHSHRAHRYPVSTLRLLSYLKLRRNPIPVLLV